MLSQDWDIKLKLWTLPKRFLILPYYGLVPSPKGRPNDASQEQGAER